VRAVGVVRSVTTLNTYAFETHDKSIKRVWSMIGKISGKRSPAEAKYLQVGDKEITTVADVADTLAESFSEISSNKHYSSKFQSHKAHAERQTLKFNSHNIETYNTPFSIHELLDALSISNDSAVGPDDIHYQILKHLNLQKPSIHWSVFSTIYGELVTLLLVGASHM